MAIRLTPEEYFGTRKNVNVQEPVHVISLQTEPSPSIPTIDPALIVLGIVAIVGLLGFLAYLAHEKR